MNRSTAAHLPRTLLQLLAVAAGMLPLVVAQSQPSADLVGAGLRWLPTALSVAVLLAAGFTTIAALVIGLRDGSLSMLLVAGTSGSLVGAALSVLAGVDHLGASLLAAAFLALASVIAGHRRLVVDGARWRVMTASGLLLIAEATLVVQLLPDSARIVDDWAVLLLVIAAIAAGVAAVLGVLQPRGIPAGFLAIGAMGLAVARPGGADLSLAFIPLLVAALVEGRALLVAAGHVPEPSPMYAPALAMHLSEGVMIFDGQLRLRSWNPAATALVGIDALTSGSRLEDLLGVTLSQLPAATETVVQRTPIGGIDVTIHREAEQLTVVLHDPGLTSDAERLGRELRGTIEELLQARRTVDLQRTELEHASIVDQLTGVASRSAILARLRLEVAESRRYRHPFAAVIVDVDGFADVNTEHGIDAGDAVLREVALRARVRVREADALGRIGSDAFLVLLPHTEAAGASTFADALRRGIGARPVQLATRPLAVTVSAGISVMHAGDDLDADRLMARLDEALASAQRDGGDQVALDRLHGLSRLGLPDDEPGSEPDDRPEDLAGT
ncbi:MAG: GGDEF domain-containing protein [Candidatus Limnocylindria bacterium]